MEKTCRVIEDLLPLYVDGVCSEESSKMIETHICQCESCKSVLKELQTEIVTNEIKADEQIPESEKVLMDVSLKISKSVIYKAVGVIAIILYWLIYIWQDKLAMLGDYRYFSYSFYEAYSFGYIIVPIYTIGWLLRYAYELKKNKSWKKGIAFLVVLLILVGGQFGYIHHLSQKVTVTSCTTVKEIIDEYHFIVEKDGEEVLLEANPTVITLLEADGTMYGFYYESSINNPNEGYLHDIWDVY